MHASTPYRPRVMIADNSKDIRALLKFWLEQKGCRVVEAVDGDEAIKLARDDCPDLILMSLRMPVRSGLDATRCIREHIGECDVPIVALSAYPTTDEHTAALAAGCTWFIAKPIDFDRLDHLFNHLCLIPTGH
jgi:two-component system CheB/CheR fusion protein